MLAHKSVPMVRAWIRPLWGSHVLAGRIIQILCSPIFKRVLTISLQVRNAAAILKSVLIGVIMAEDANPRRLLEHHACVERNVNLSTAPFQADSAWYDSSAGLLISNNSV